MYIIPGYTKYSEESSSIYVVSKLLQNKVALTDPAIQDEFRTIVSNGGCQELSTPLTRFLHEQELLVSEVEADCALSKVKELLGNSLMLTIMPTEGCNFACPYCYETHSSANMSRELLTQIHTYIANQAQHCRFISLSWFGGEPTLCKETILETSALVQSLQHRYGFDYKGQMTTNGYLLDLDSFLEYFRAGIIDYQVTLDGWDHDKMRPHISGSGTLQTILKNLIALVDLPKSEYKFHVIIRRNVLNGDNDFSWYDYMHKLFGADDRFSISVCPVCDWGGDSVKSLNIASKSEKEILATAHESYLDKIGMRRERAGTTPFSNICASSCSHGFVFRADGKIEKCTIVLDHPKNLVGRVDPQAGVILDEDANRSWTSSELKPKCYTCPDVLSCLNICCRKTVLVDGRPDSVCLCATSTESQQI